MAGLQKITPFLWFNQEAEEAANLYVSLFKDCLTANGGQESQCGWLKDRFGLFIQMMKDQDPKRSQRVMQAMLTMKKFDIARLEEAYAQA